MLHEGFPKPVAKLNSTEVWMREDIEAFPDGEEAWPNRECLALSNRELEKRATSGNS